MGNRIFLKAVGLFRKFGKIQSQQTKERLLT